MEEDSGVKAPVTRLRRRLSVEQSDDVNSPGPATPTKKRGGRLAAKPQLELISENAADITPSKRTTRKASVKEIAEAAEEKTLTPSRRSTRIKSNTSIVSETTQSYDSPRAKRAARRTSQVGSDSESSVTPARQTRRTRKDSASSIENIEVLLAGKPYITEVIIEEDSMSVKSDDIVKTNATSPSTSIRKSPRLREKQKEKEDKKSIHNISNKVEDSKNSSVGDESKQNMRKNRKSLEHNTVDQSPEDKLKEKENKKDRKSLDQTNNLNNESMDENNTKNQLNVSTQNRKQDRKSIEQTNNKDDNELSILQQNLSSTEVDTCNDDAIENNLNNSKSKQKSRSSKSNNDSEDNNDISQKELHLSKENKRPGLDIEITITSTTEYDHKETLEKSNINQISTEGTSGNNLDHVISEGTVNMCNNNADSSLIMIQELDKKPKKKLSIMNKSTSSLTYTTDLHNKRQRTKSWTVTSLSQDKEGTFLSDNETTKKKLTEKSSRDFKSKLNHTGSGDNKNDKPNLPQPEKDEVDSSLTPLKSSKVRSSKEFMSPNKELNNKYKSVIIETISPQGNKENIVTANSDEVIGTPPKFFEKEPTALLQSTIYYEDSDAESKGKENIVHLDGDQCVPVIDNNLVDTSSIPVKENLEKESVFSQKNDDASCEPMDIDETIPNNVSLTEYPETKLNKSLENYKQNPVSYSPLKDSSLNKNSKKSKLKSSLSNLEKSETENKSTLILSQLKDISSTEHNVSKKSKEVLSKSVDPADSGKDKTLDKKNISQDYSTSTPLQQKKFPKLGIQMNSSIINSSGIELKQEKSKNTSKKDISKISASSESSSEEGSDSEGEGNSSVDKNKFLDDEADVASDNYESGDSRDDDERQYEDENEIVEKGETLDSEDDVSDDTDYEKDSFVVSSDEEDNDLLSGSGDDLSMSDRELSMSKKSKKKFNERKEREQKKASREMYEARHSLKYSEVSIAKKKKKRQQLESSEDSSDSDDEILAPTKKNKNLRLDSTCEDDMEKTNSSVSKKKSKIKRLSESICDEIPIEEHQISTIDIENVTQNDDPLTVQVKIEPKTPMKDLNISTVQINENIEEVQVENNVSVMKTNQGTDPLHLTMLGEDADSSISEDSEIMNNYDSVLNELNSASKTKTIKSLDISLNLNKKRNNKVTKEPIIDELNLTETKKNKSFRRDITHTNIQSESKDEKNITHEDSGSTSSTSDSINLQLLFSEDSNDYEDAKNKSTKQNYVDEFIPLKRTPGKTNILSCEDGGPSKVESMKKKNKKLKSHGVDERETNDSDDGIQIIVDTQGTYENTDESFNMSLTSSAKKKKNSSVTFNKEETILGDNDDAPEEVSYRSEKAKNKKKNRKSSEANNVEADIQSQDTGKSFNSTLNSDSAKKKKKLCLENQAVEENDVAPKLDLNISHNTSKKSLNISQELAESHNTSQKMGSEKKKKKKLSETPVHEDKEICNHTDISLNESSKSAKKKKQKSEATNISLVNEEGNGNTSTDKNISTQKQNHVEDISEIENAQSETVEMSKKRKRKSSVNEDVGQITMDKKDKPNIQKSPNTLNESLRAGHQSKKRKTSPGDDVAETAAPTDAGAQKKKNNKRKVRDYDDGNSVSKIFKENSFDMVPIPRLPSSVLKLLEDKPRKEVLESKKSSVVSTTPFTVEDTRKRRNKPSKFLEESVYLNDTNIEQKQKGNIKTPKVLPFIPTAITSGSGFTTNFKINVIPQEVQFVAQTKNAANFKNDYLYGKKIKRLGTYETYRKHRNAKMTKF